MCVCVCVHCLRSVHVYIAHGLARWNVKQFLGTRCLQCRKSTLLESCLSLPLRPECSSILCIQDLHQRVLSQVPGNGRTQTPSPREAFSFWSWDSLLNRCAVQIQTPDRQNMKQRLGSRLQTVTRLVSRDRPLRSKVRCITSVLSSCRHLLHDKARHDWRSPGLATARWIPRSAFARQPVISFELYFLPCLHHPQRWSELRIRTFCLCRSARSWFAEFQGLRLLQLLAWAMQFQLHFQ